MDKTAVISLEWRQRHPLYGKQVRRITKAYAHDERNECKTGDLVAITETRPLSKTKRWRVVEILNRQALSVQEVLQNEGAEDTSEAIDEE
jgi:small subunit ribosomal protein S17